MYCTTLKLFFDDTQTGHAYWFVGQGANGSAQGEEEGHD